MRYLLSAAVLLCGAVAVRLASAELVFRDDSAVQVHRALRLLGSTPNANYSERLADLEPLLEAESLQRALRENPRSTPARIRLGLLEEQHNDFASAERTLLEAARLDHLYLAAWTLANYYFRRENREAFWQWSRRATALCSGDPRPLLRLASLFEPDPRVVLVRLKAGERVAYSYLDLLIEAGRLDLAQQLARVLLAAQPPHGSGRPHLLDLATRQLKAGHVSWALELWNALDAPLDPEHGPLLPPAPFQTADGEGFHLRALANAGSLTEWRADEVSFSFEGAEPDVCPLLEQPVPAPRREMRYRLRFEYTGGATGVRWRMGAEESAALAPGSQWRQGEWIVSISSGQIQDAAKPDRLRVLPLQLVYRRDPGTLNARGILSVRNLQLTIL